MSSRSEKGFFAFFQQEAASAIVLLTTAAGALMIANSPLAESYFSLLHLKLRLGYGAASLELSVIHWINDAFMVIFFLLVGLEIKRELIYGELSNRKQATLPIVAAVGGMLAPALIYASFNRNTTTSHGWAVPTATDIAFAIGVLGLLGRKINSFFKVFLTALAIIDDLGAVIIIAFFYTQELSLQALCFAGAIYLLLLLLKLFPINRALPYLLLGICLWLAVLHSGIHATISGVLLATTIPAKKDGKGNSLLETLESRLHPWVAFGIMPLFAFANAGVSVSGNYLANLGTHPLSIGIISGLVLGKPIGIIVVSLISQKIGIVKIPAGLRRRHFAGIAALAGIGFTMSLFIAALAFTNPEFLDIAKISVLVASLISALVGYALLR